MTFEPCDPPEVNIGWVSGGTKPRSQTEMVGRIMSDGHWWSPRGLRQTLMRRYDVDAEAITARIRELRQRGVTVESRKVPGQKCHEYRVVG